MQDALRASRAGPVEVITLLAKWDTAGTRFKAGYVDKVVGSAYLALVCWVPEEHCTTDEPGWDAATIVRSYTIRLLWRRGDSAQVEATYTAVAETGDVPRIIPRASIVRWQPLLLRMERRWRVVDPNSQKHPYESIATALRGWALTKADSAALDSLARLPIAPLDEVDLGAR